MINKVVHPTGEQACDVSQAGISGKISVRCETSALFVGVDGTS